MRVCPGCDGKGYLLGMGVSGFPISIACDNCSGTGEVETEN